MGQDGGMLAKLSGPTKMNDQSAHEQLTDLEKIFRDLPVGFCTFDLNFRFLFVNEWLAELNGVAVSEHHGRTIHEVIPDVALGVEAQLRQVIEAAKPIVGSEVEAETRAYPGEKRVFQPTYTPVNGANDEIIGLSCIVQDITERKRSEAALRESKERFRNFVESSADWFWEMD